MVASVREVFCNAIKNFREVNSVISQERNCSLSMNSQAVWGDWTGWIQALWNPERESAQPEDFTRSQLSLDEGWKIIESEADKMLEEETMNQAFSRRSEIEKLRNELAKKNSLTGSIDWKKFFTFLLEVCKHTTTAHG